MRDSEEAGRDSEREERGLDGAGRDSEGAGRALHKDLRGPWGRGRGRKEGNNRA